MQTGANHRVSICSKYDNGLAAVDAMHEPSCEFAMQEPSCELAKATPRPQHFLSRT